MILEDCAGSPIVRYKCFDGLVVKASTLGVEDPGFKSRPSYTSDFKIGTQEAFLVDFWHCMVRGWPSVTVL